MPVRFSPQTRNITRWDVPKVNYIGITKCGNTSMKHHLYELENGQRFPKEQASIKIHSGNHTKAATLEQANQNGYKNIIVVRHPFTRFMSMWKDMVMTRPDRGKLAGVHNYKTPLQLIKWILDQEIQDLDVHFLPQYIFAADVKDPYILPLENIPEWSNIVDLDYDIRPLLNENETSEVHIDSKFITKELKELVFKMYFEDFKRFNYRMEDVNYPDNDELEKVISPRIWNLKGEEFTTELQRDKVLIVGSGRSASDIKDWELNGWSLLTINHAYQIRPDWEFAGYAGDFPKNDRPIAKFPHSFAFSHRTGPQGRAEIVEKSDIRSYENAMRQFGKKHMTMFFNASYWALVYLKPKVIGYMGCDMNYKAEAGQATHFYGIGKDIQKRGIPDPDKFIKQHYKGDKKALDILFTELGRDAEAQSCKLVNFSQEETRLPYEKADWNNFKL